MTWIQFPDHGKTEDVVALTCNSRGSDRVAEGLFFLFSLFGEFTAMERPCLNINVVSTWEMTSKIDF